MSNRACKSSGDIATTAAVTTVPCLVWGITLRSGTTAGKIILQDGNGGTAKWTITTIASTAAGDAVNSISFAKPLIFTSSCYAVMSGTAAVGLVEYEVM